MEFINKNNQTIFYPFYIRFENNKWNNSSSNYGNYNYDGFFKNNIKNSVKSLLIDEQNSLCCYCMKHLEKNDSSTIEHLYPNNPQIHNIFTNYHLSCTEKINFNFGVRQFPNTILDNLPHDISYYNLLACCLKCNNTRDTKEIRPFIFVSDIKTKFLYNDEGNIYSNEYEDEIIKIGLADSYYVQYRHLWKHIAKTESNSIFANDKKLKKIVVKAALALHIKTNSIFYIDFVKNGLKVKEAIDYKYFLDN